MSPLALHSLFDALAWLAALGCGLLVARWRGAILPPRGPVGGYYLPVLIAGSAAGAFLFGTLNLRASGHDGLARSIEGAIVGGILCVEIYKRAVGIKGRTGARLAAPLAAGIVVGRIGCFLAGLEDFTHGTPTTLPWAHDFGDGIPRHPVQLYESLSMAVFLTAYLVALARRSEFVATNGFTLAVGFYALQRFGWEFLKPYGPVIGPLTIFHLTSLAIIAYAMVLLAPALPRIGKDAPMA